MPDLIRHPGIIKLVTESLPRAHRVHFSKNRMYRRKRRWKSWKINRLHYFQKAARKVNRCWSTMKYFKNIILIVLISISIICMIRSYNLSNYYIYNMPRCPNYETGRVYEFNVHRSYVYVTKEEKRQVDWLNLMSLLSFSSTIILGVIFRRNTEGRLNGLLSK